VCQLRDKSLKIRPRSQESQFGIDLQAFAPAHVNQRWPLMNEWLPRISRQPASGRR
jgi:hypothetical protein